MDFLGIDTSQFKDKFKQSEYISAGFDNFDFLQNQIYYLIIAGIGLAAIIIIYLIGFLIRKLKDEIRRYLKKLIRKMMWNKSIVTFKFIYLKTLISAFLAIRAGADWKVILIIFVFVTLPIYFFYLLVINQSRLSKRDCESSYGVLYQSLKISKYYGVLPLTQPLVFFLHRFLFALIPITLINYPAIQI